MHKFSLKIYQTLIVIAVIFFHSCVEEIDVNIDSSEQALVVETLITNEYKNHVIKLSKSYGFEESGSSPEMNAKVYIEEGSRQINFAETSPGIYTSANEFAAQPNTPYKLHIERSNGIKYESLASEIKGVTSIDSLYADKIADEFGNEFVSIYVDSYDPTGNSVYYRYEYEETYQIVAPYWTPFDLNVPTLNPKLILKTTEQQVCYGKDQSIDIIQKETSNLTADQVSKFTVLSLSKEDPKIRTRYSLLVKQYVESMDAYSYYKTLKNFSGSDNILSQNQPGFFEGNIFSVDDPQNNKVLGFFEVASVSYARIFFNYIDLFPESYSPNYFIDCQEGTPPASDAREVIQRGTYKYYRDNPNFPNPLDENEGPWIIVAAPCGDCTQLGSNVKPDYWED